VAVVAAALLSVAAVAPTGAQTGRPPLITAARDGDVEAVTRLLDARTDPNVRNPETRHTALMAAASYNRLEVVRLLLARGADPSLRDAEGRTALVRAQEAGHAEVIAALQAATNRARPVAPTAVAAASGATGMAAGGPPVGKYACHYTRYMQVVPSGSLITVLAPGRYRYLARGGGAFRFDPATTTLAWTTGPLVGAGIDATYYRRASDGRPVIKLVLPDAGRDAQGRPAPQTNFCIGPAS
jgi:hypothetical protein